MINDKYPTTKPSLNLDFANTKSLDPRITFRRGTPGTYYDGVTHAKAEENLLHNSVDNVEASDATVSETTGQGAPNGTSEASLITYDGTNALHYAYIDGGSSNLESNTYTYSLHLKKGTQRYMQVFNQMNGSTVNIDLDTGETFSRDLSVIDHGSIDLGNGWYRVYATHIGVSRDLWYVPVDSLDSGYHPSTTTSGTVYVWGGQIEQRESVTSYTATNGTPITKYQPKLMTAAADRARFDHDPLTGESKGLLIEEQRTNLIAYSEDFESSFWNKSWDGTNVGYSSEHIYSNQAIAPDGSLSASKVSPGSDSGVHYVGSDQANILQNTTYTISCYLKKGEMDTAIISMWSYANVNEGVSFDLTNGVSDASWGGAEILDHSMTHVGNDWYRCTFTVNSGTGDANNSGFLYIYVDSAGGTIPSGYSGNGFDGLYIWGFQVEQATFPTSYIKTTGASATRSADNASITGENFSSWYRQDEGSILFDLKLNEDSGWKYIFGITTNGNWQQDLISSRHLGSNLQAILKRQSVDFNSSQIGFSQDGNFFNLGFVYKNDSTVINTSIGSDEYAPKIASGLNRIDLFSINGSDYKSCGHIKKLAYYPQRLTNEQLQNLTK